MIDKLNYSGTLEDALDEAKQLDTINELTEEELIESIELGKLDLTEAYSSTDDSQILFSPQIEVFEPWAAHVDASRTNMSAKQLLQTVTSDNNDAPYVLNKNHQAMTNINSPFIEYAKEDGVILYSNFNFLIIYYLASNELETLYCPDVKKLTNNTLTLKYKLDMNVNKKFKKDDILFDYTGQTLDGNVPKIGYRTKILYGSFYGYTADDAFVMSESYAERTRIDYSKKVFVPITKELKYLKNSLDKYLFGPGEISDVNYLEYFKIDSSDSMLSEFNNTSTRQSKIYGKSVDSIHGGTIKSLKVHRITDKTFDELHDEYIYTTGLIREVQENYQRQIEIKKDMFKYLNNVFTVEGQAVDFTNNIFSQWESTDKFPNMALEAIATDYRIDKDKIDYVVEIEIYKSEPTCVGDKFANVFAGKGVCSLILPDNIMPGGADIIFNPLGLFGRNNWGTVFEMGISKVIQDIESHIDDKSKVLSRLEFVRQNFIDKFDKEYSEALLQLMYSFDDPAMYETFKQSVLKNGLYFFVDNFPGLTFKDYIDNFILLYQEQFDINITEKETIVYSEELMQFLRDRGFIHSVWGSDVVQAVEQECYIGYNYWIKLFHTSYSKYNAISFANSYSKSTGEPPRGRTKGGGCHISWQSTAALIGHMEGNPCSVELRTIKSDAVQDKNNFNRKMIQNGEYIMKDKYKSPTVNTLNNGLNMLCLKFSSIHDNNDEDSFDNDYSEALEDEEEISIDDLFTGGNKEYERSDNQDLEIDEETVVPKHNLITGEIINDVVDVVDEVPDEVPTEIQIETPPEVINDVPIDLNEEIDNSDIEEVLNSNSVQIDIDIDD